MRHHSAPSAAYKVRLGLLALAALLPALPPAWAAEPLVFKEAGRTGVELPSGERVAVSLPQGADLSAAYDTSSGWLATGTKPAAGGREIVLLSGRGPAVNAAKSIPPPPGRG